MTASRVQSEPLPGAVRLCPQCGRTMAALHKNEYTPARARLVAATGLCVCSPGRGNGVARVPERGPSLL